MNQKLKGIIIIYIKKGLITSAKFDPLEKELEASASWAAGGHCRWQFLIHKLTRGGGTSAHPTRQSLRQSASTKATNMRTIHTMNNGANHDLPPIFSFVFSFFHLCQNSVLLFLGLKRVICR